MDVCVSGNGKDGWTVRGVGGTVRKAHRHAVKRHFASIDKHLAAACLAFPEIQIVFAGERKLSAVDVESGAAVASGGKRRRIRNRIRSGKHLPRSERASVIHAERQRAAANHGAAALLHASPGIGASSDMEYRICAGHIERSIVPYRNPRPKRIVVAGKEKVCIVERQRGISLQDQKGIRIAAARKKESVVRTVVRDFDCGIKILDRQRTSFHLDVLAALGDRQRPPGTGISLQNQRAAAGNRSRVGERDGRRTVDRYDRIGAVNAAEIHYVVLCGHTFGTPLRRITPQPRNVWRPSIRSCRCICRKNRNCRR